MELHICLGIGCGTNGMVLTPRFELGAELQIEVLAELLAGILGELHGRIGFGIDLSRTIEVAIQVRHGGKSQCRNQRHRGNKRCRHRKEGEADKTLTACYDRCSEAILRRAFDNMYCYCILFS